MVTEVDTSGDGEIDILEFKAAMGNNAKIQKASKTALKRRDWAKHFQEAVVEVAQAAGVQQAKRKKISSAVKAPSKSGTKAPGQVLNRGNSYETALREQKVISEPGETGGVANSFHQAGGGRDGVDTEPAHKRQKTEPTGKPNIRRQPSNTKTKIEEGVFLVRQEHQKGEQDPVVEPVPFFEPVPDDAGFGFGSPRPGSDPELDGLFGNDHDWSFGDLLNQADELSASAVPDDPVEEYLANF